jgi:hypothetical protein
VISQKIPRSYLISPPDTPATQHAFGKEAVGVAFILGNMKTTASGSRAAPSKATTKNAWKGTKGGRKGQKRRPGASLSRLATTAMMKKQMTLARSVSRPLSVISSARRSSQRTILRNFSKRPVQTTHALSNTSSRIAP